MKTALSNNAVNVIVKSLPMMERNRVTLGSALGRYMARRRSYDSSAGGEKILRGAITDMLFDHAREIAGARPLLRIEETARRHRVLGLTREHYSRFGDGLGAVMKDVLGANASPRLLAAWGDAYWAIVRSVARQDQLLAA
jgi:nitric oxide dioxygenase